MKKEKNLKQFAQAAFNNKKVFLNFIDAYVSKKNKQNIIPWHTDQAYHGNLSPKNFVNHEKFFLKIFIYLTDVSSKNGCMSYIPGSHKIGFAIRKGIFEKKIEYQPYWNLIDLRNLVKKIKNIYLIFLVKIFF